MNNYKRGLITGIPIALGYLSVSFTFGIMAVSFGLSWWQAVLISMTTVTSAGQFAGIGIMIHPGQYIQMLISQITINIRYSFMSISIGQKADSRFSGIYRWLLGFFITDEIFAEFDKVIGLDQIAVFHINDSMNPLGAHKDRHANIDKGNIGYETLHRLVHDERFLDVPKILETPWVAVEGTDKKEPPYKEEIAWLLEK